MDRAEALGLTLGFLPTWGRYWHDRVKDGKPLFTPGNAAVYGEWLGRRYRDRAVIWILGGDRPVETDLQKEVLRSLARGLRRGDGGAHLITFHPSGGDSSSQWLHDEEWLDFNMHQTGHCPGVPVWERMAADRARSPAKPVLDGEPLYEDHPLCFDPKKNGFSSDWQVRRLAWWDVLAGACGHTYGCHDVWQMLAPGRRPISWAHRWWYEALDLWGARDMRHVKDLVLSRPYLLRIPDDSLVVDPPGGYDEHAAAARGSDGSYAFVYSPVGAKLTVDLEKLSGASLKAWWFDPRHGTAAGIGTFPRKGSREFTPPIAGKGNDWVLVLDDAGRGFSPPGAPSR